MTRIAVIPARFASTRFPGKPLVNIAGTSMIQRVYEQVSLVHSLTHVIVATDDERIEAHVKQFGGRVMMTSPEHQSGTDRCAEVAAHFPDADIVLNIQGDEPFINPLQIEELMDCFNTPETQIATLIRKIESEEELFNENTPKVVVNNRFQALYFSRQTIPFQRNVAKEEWLQKQVYYKHIGIYGFRAKTLLDITQLPSASLEHAEALEQLRWLQNGYEIQTSVTQYQSFGIDLQEDIEKVLSKINP